MGGACWSGAASSLQPALVRVAARGQPSGHPASGGGADGNAVRRRRKQRRKRCGEKTGWGCRGCEDGSVWAVGGKVETGRGRVYVVGEKGERGRGEAAGGGQVTACERERVSAGVLAGLRAGGIVVGSRSLSRLSAGVGFSSQSLLERGCGWTVRRERGMKLRWLPQPPSRTRGSRESRNIFLRGRRKG